jgi:hypothetical protein
MLRSSIDRWTDELPSMKSSTIVAVTIAVTLTACSASTSPSIDVSNSSSPVSVVTATPSAIRSPTTATSSAPTHTPVLLTVKYRSVPVDIAHPRFDHLNGRSSTLVDAAHYDSENGYMIVSLTGTAYHYCDMPRSVWAAFTEASSLGSFFNSEVKGMFDCRTGSVPEY